MASLLVQSLVAALIGGAAWAVSSMVTMGVIALAEQRQLLAPVNHRSSHKVPVPRLGGVGIMMGNLVGFLSLALVLVAGNQLPEFLRPVDGAMPLSTLALMAGAAFGAFLLGLWDDLGNVPAAVKLVGQLVLCLVPPLLGLRLEQIHLPGMPAVIELAPAVGIPLTVLWLLAIMNAFNFMDGINGIAGRFAQVVAVGSLIGVVLYRGGETILYLAPAIFGACGGFLGYNVPRARTFMGDCGSQPLGLLLGLLGIHISQLPTTYPLPFIAYVVMVSPFLYDVAITLVKRLLEGRNVFQAHREHLYQRHLIATGEDHLRTLWFFESHHLPLVVLGTVYLLLFWRPTDAIWQAAILGLSLIVLAHYTWQVLAAEDRNPMAVR